VDVTLCMYINISLMQHCWITSKGKSKENFVEANTMTKLQSSVLIVLALFALFSQIYGKAITYHDLALFFYRSSCSLALVHKVWMLIIWNKILMSLWFCDEQEKSIFVQNRWIFLANVQWVLQEKVALKNFMQD